MKRNLFLSLSFIVLSMICAGDINAQAVAINDNGSAPNASAILDVNVFGVSKKGVLVPRMTTAQRTAIAAPATSLLVFDSNTNSFWYYGGAGPGWIEIISNSNNLWATGVANSIHNTNSGNVGIGTAAVRAKFHVATNNTVLFGLDTLSSTIGEKFIWFGSKAAVRFATIDFAGNTSWDYANIGQNSIAIGEGAMASAPQSFSQGYFSNATGFYSFARGFVSSANGDHGMSFGQNLTSNGIGAIAFGGTSTINGNWAFSNGLNNVATGNFTGSFGQNLTARPFNAFVIGRYNDSIQTSSTSAWVDTDPLFIIGNGTGINARSNAVTVLKNGNFGIGNTSPDALLQVGVSTGSAVRIGSIETLEDFGGNLLSVNSTFVPATDNSRNLGSASNRWISVFAVDGTINTSDAREKHNIQSIAYGLSDLMKLNPVRFDWNDNRNADGPKLGLIAQEVLNVIPEVVKTHETIITDEKTGQTQKKELNRYGIYYSDLIPVLIKSIQEQQTVIADQKQKIEDLEKRIMTIEAKLK